MKRLLADACFLVSAIRSCESNHMACYSFFRNNESAIWVVPTIAYFEYQATQSKMKALGMRAYREIFIQYLEVMEISQSLIRRTAELNLACTFEHLRGADLIYACIAKLMAIPLVTCDTDFDRYRNEIDIINPMSL